MYEQFYEDLKKLVERDLASFADPGRIKTTEGKKRFEAEWRMRGKHCQARFRLSKDAGITVFMERHRFDYKVFLASPYMADLRYLAQMIKTSQRQQLFVSTRASTPDRPQEAKPAKSLLLKLLQTDRHEDTEVIMVTGEAGSGKTRVLQELVRSQAESYYNGRSSQLLLYVNAQGRALARLNEALATELQDLRAHLTYHSVATLTRVGVLVPVIDGFDELLGVVGYDDAFSSLAIFLNQLNGEGKLIASARSAYYQEEFLKRASQVSVDGIQYWSHTPVTIHSWNQQDQDAFIRETARINLLSDEDQRTLKKHVSGAFNQNQQLASKPLFFAKLTELLRTDPNFEGGSDLLSTITSWFLEREQMEKLLDRQARPLLSISDLKELLSELAEEMWNQETRELDLVSVREVAQYVLDEHEMPESDGEIVVKRAPYLAFLMLGEQQDCIQFEHEIYFSYFLCRALVDQYLEGLNMRMILSRSALPDYVAERFAIQLRQRDLLSTSQGLQVVFDRVSNAGKQRWRRMIQVRENAGRIVLAVLREFASKDDEPAEVRDCTLTTVVLPGGELRNVTFRRCIFEDIQIKRTNLELTKFLDCTVRDVMFIEPKIGTESTRLELSGLRPDYHVMGVEKLSATSSYTIFDPTEILQIFASCGAPVSTGFGSDVWEVTPEVLDLLNRLMRAYARANPLCEADHTLRSLFRNDKWKDLRNLLVKHGIVKVETRSMSGVKKDFLRRKFSPSRIMAGRTKANRIDPQIARFWESLTERMG